MATSRTLPPLNIGLANSLEGVVGSSFNAGSANIQPTPTGAKSLKQLELWNQEEFEKIEGLSEERGF
jgi:hypothetical protein